MAIKVNSINFKFSDCRQSYGSKIPIFSYGGGAYGEFGVFDLWHCQRHLLLFGWCFLTVKYTKDNKRKLFVRKIRKFTKEYSIKEPLLIDCKCPDCKHIWTAFLPDGFNGVYIDCPNCKKKKSAEYVFDSRPQGE